MSILYLPVPKNFKTDTLGARYRPRALRANDFDITKILDHVLTSLFASQFAIVKSNVLCLVNAYAPDNRMSIGFSDAPNEATLMPNTGIAFTFSIKPRPVKTLPYPDFINGRSRNWRTWGQNGINEFITVSVPRNMLFGLDGQGMDLLNVLYNAVGVISRNHMQTFNSPRMEPAIITQDVSALNSMYQSKSLVQTVKHVPYAEWQYVRDVWDNNSNWLMPKMFDKNFPLYYVMYLSEWVYSPDLNEAAQAYVSKTVTDFLAKGLMKFGTSLSLRQPDMSDELAAALYMLLSDKDRSDLEGGKSSRTSFVRKYYLRLDQALEVPEYTAALVRYATSNHYQMARDLLSGNYNEQLKNLIAYANLIEV